VFQIVPFKVFVTRQTAEVEFRKLEKDAHVSFTKTPVLFVPNTYPLTFVLLFQVTLKLQDAPALTELAETEENVGASTPLTNKYAATLDTTTRITTTTAATLSLVEIALIS
jgi:fumarate reductase subunit C